MNNYQVFPSITLAVGFCNSGKTTALKYCINTIQKFDFYIVISNTALFNEDWDFLKNFDKPLRIYDGSKINEVLELILRIQETNLKLGKIQTVGLILDDILGCLNNTDVFKKMVSCYRHFKISIFITTQFCNSSTTMIRELSNYIYVFDQRSEGSKKAIFQSYFNDISTFNDFKKIFAGLKPFQFFFIDRVKKKRVKMIVPTKKPIVEESKDLEIFNYCKSL